MPPGVFPVPKFRPTPSRSAGVRPSLALRVRASWRRNRLDDELARGAEPAASAELGLRAAQLRSRAERSRLANALVETLGGARGPNLGAFRMKTRRQHAGIRESADDLLALVLRLRDDQPIDVRGAAMAARLLNDRAAGRQLLRALVGCPSSMPPWRGSAHRARHPFRQHQPPRSGGASPSGQWCCRWPRSSATIASNAATLSGRRVSSW